jgi:hypothetical protein
MNGLSKRLGKETSLHINLLPNPPNKLRLLNSKHLELNELQKLLCHHEIDSNGTNNGRTRHLSHPINPNHCHLSHLYDSNAVHRINRMGNSLFPNKGIKMTLHPNYLRT